ncbi:MAG: serine hydrolase [Clostridiales bacterium]|jgi:beta-lactamase class A|nr:serine hydrolase [Clostridiales bacterium]
MKKPAALILILAIVVVSGVILFGRLTDREPEKRPARDSTLTRLETFIEESPNEISLVYYDFADESMEGINESKKIFPASMIKSLFLLAALEKVKEGELSLDETYTLKEEDKYMNDKPVTGSGTMQNEEPGKEFRVEEILHLMVSISDNIAANVTVDLVGRDSITNLLDRMGLNNTSAQQKMFEPPNGVPRNMSTAIDLTKMLIALENATVVNEKLSQEGISMMKDTTDKNRIGRNLEDGITLANKIGTASSMIGDMGLLYFPNRPPIALTIMVENPDDPDQAEEEIGQLTSIIVDSLGQ